MSSEEVKQARAWLHAHKPRTIAEMDAIDAEAKRLYKHHMDIIKADLDAWFQQVDPEGYAALLAQARWGAMADEVIKE